MATYRSLKRFYTQGAFYGLDEETHAHTLADQGEAVVNRFNLSDQPVERTVTIRPEEIGLPAGPLTVEGAPAEQVGGAVSVRLTIPAHGHVLLRIGTKG